ncbi:MAG: histidinol-phosphate transaminase [Candidatus Saccharibacteria bacterium]
MGSNFVKRNARPEIFNLKPYVPGKPIEEVEREMGISNVIKMASNENPLGPSPKALKRLEEMLPKLYLYPDGASYYLKTAVAAKLGLDPDGLVFGNGSDELLRLLNETFIGPQEEIVFANPSFSEYEFMATIMGGKCISVPLKDFRHDLSSMKDQVNDNTKMVYICNPNNPTGSIVTGQEIAEFMDDLPDDILVVFDEAYVEYVDNPDFVSGLEYLNKGRNVIVLRTFSKIYGLAGLRVGYGITTKEIADAINSVREPFNVNLAAQEAARAAIEDDDHVKRSQELNLAGRAFLYKAFGEMGLKYVPTEANFIFVDIKQDCKKVFTEMLKLGVIIRTGDIFGHPTFIRVTIGTAEQNERFINTLKKVLGA